MRLSLDRLLPFVLLAALAALACGASHPALVVDWGNAPSEFEGADVEIDGKLVGKLTRDGQRPRTSFAVDAGDHAVRLAAPKYDTRPDVVSVKPGEELVLVAEIKPASSPGARPGVVLHR
jgi:hypothetical protein